MRSQAAGQRVGGKGEPEQTPKSRGTSPKFDDDDDYGIPATTTSLKNKLPKNPSTAVKGEIDSAEAVCDLRNLTLLAMYHKR